VPVLLLAYLFLGVYYNFSVWFKLTDKTYFGTIITLGGAVVTFIANYLLIPHWGYVGSSWASVICYGSMAVVCYWFGQKNYPIPYHIFSGVLYISAAFLLSYFLTPIALSTPFYTSLFHNGVIIAFFMIVLYFEKENLKNLQ
jgi:Na+-driven multidrug efflux pump